MVDAVETDPFGKVDAIDVLDLASLEARAEKILGRGEFGYISEGSDDGYTMRRNTTAFTDVQMLPRVLQGVEKPDQSTTFMGARLASPLLTAPIAENTLAHPSGELGLAKGAKEAGIMISQSTFASKTIAETAAVSDGAPLYVPTIHAKRLVVLPISVRSGKTSRRIGDHSDGRFDTWRLSGKRRDESLSSQRPFS